MLEGGYEIMYNQENWKTGNQWYYIFKGERRGPETDDGIRELFERGFINKKTLVWKQGFSDWVPISQSGIDMEEKGGTIPPPLTARHISNKSFIFLLFVPILATIIQYLIAGYFQIDVNELWWLMFVLNIICFSIDYFIVKKAGYNADKLTVAFLLFTPLYIYRRMKLVQGNKWFFTLVWTLNFLLAIFIPSTAWVKVVGMSNPAIISSLKGGSFQDYADTTIEKMFEATLNNCEWDTYVGPAREVFVDIKGYESGNLLDTVFEVNMDSSFQVFSMTYAGETFAPQQINNVLQYLYEQSKQTSFY